MEQRLIDANKLKDIISDTWILDRIDEQPTVDPIKHGHWLFYEEPDGYYYTECSECGQWCDEDVFLKGKWHYCPNCGAKMDEMAVTYYGDNKPVETIVIDERREDERT